MSLSLNNPLIIGDINKKTKEDISQIKQDIGDLSQLDTADKSSLVNALNEAIDSTLNGASRDLDNLSDVGNDKLRSLNSYADEGELLTDSEGLADVTKYAHSTFDRSKFTVVGSPNITDDGIASGFTTSNYLKNTSLFSVPKDKIKISAEFIVSNATNETTVYSYGDGDIRLTIKNDYIQWLLRGNAGTLFPLKNVTINNGDKVKVETNIVEGNLVAYISINGSMIEPYTYSSDNLSFITFQNQGLYIGCSQILTGVFTGSIDLKQFSITIDGTEVFSGNKTGVDTIKPDDYQVVGAPTISADGVVSGFSGASSLTNYITFSSDFLNSDTWEVPLKINTGTLGNSDIEDIISGSVVDGFRLVINSLKLIFAYKLVGSTGASQQSSAFLQANTDYWIKIKFNGTRYSVLVSTDGITYTEAIGFDSTKKITYQNLFGLGINIGEGLSVRRPFTTGSIDLNAFKIYIDGDLVYQPCLKIPYTESKTGSKIVDSIYRDRVADMSAQFGYANYYTLDEDNGNFTLPQVELYGLIGQRTLRDSYRNGINYWELYSNRDLEQGGSCTSGVEVTFARPFADTNYVLSVPYSAKSATAFTPTQTGDWIAKGKGLL